MSDAFDPAEMIARFAERAAAVTERGMPPVEGPERAAWIARAKLDYMDYAMLADATATLVDGVLTLQVDLRPPSER